MWFCYYCAAMVHGGTIVSSRPSGVRGRDLVTMAATEPQSLLLNL